jgi:carbamoyl-phosphate synthase large subunit
LTAAGIPANLVRKHSEGSGEDGIRTALEIINSGEVALVINTPLGRGTRHDGWLIRTAAVQRSIPCITTIAGFKAAVAGMIELQHHDFSIESLQEWLAE